MHDAQPLFFVEPLLEVPVLQMFSVTSRLCLYFAVPFAVFHSYMVVHDNVNFYAFDFLEGQVYILNNDDFLETQLMKSDLLVVLFVLASLERDSQASSFLIEALYRTYRCTNNLYMFYVLMGIVARLD